MAEELVSTVGMLATSMANCNIVKADENGVVILSEYPQMTNGTCIGGGGYFEGNGIVIGEGNSLVGNASWASQIVIGCNACVGKGTTPYTSDNIAIGNGAKAIDGSMAVGTCATASMNSSTALGSGATASGWASMALGLRACATERSSTALGHNACAYGTVSTALGFAAGTTGYGALAIGASAEAAENEIVLRSESAYCSTTQSSTCNVLKVSSEGVLTLNGEEVGNTCVYAEVASKFSAIEEITTTDNAYSLSDIATKLNEILKLLKNEATA